MKPWLKGQEKQDCLLGAYRDLVLHDQNILEVDFTARRMYLTYWTTHLEWMKMVNCMLYLIWQKFKICSCDDDFEGSEIKPIEIYFLLYSLQKMKSKIWLRLLLHFNHLEL